MYPTECPGPNSVLALPHFIRLPEWTSLAAAVEHRLHEHPNDTVILDCGRLTGLSPDALLALGQLLRSAAGRVKLRNWPATVLRDLLPQLVATRVLDGLMATVLMTAQRLRAVAPDPELDRAVSHLAASVAELKQTWFGIDGTDGPQVPSPRPDERAQWN